MSVSIELHGETCHYLSNYTVKIPEEGSLHILRRENLTQTRFV